MIVVAKFTMQKKNAFSLYFLIFLALTVNSVKLYSYSSKEKLINSGKRPEWVNNPSQGYIVGVGESESEQHSRNIAVQDVKKQVLDFLGTRISVEERKITETSGETSNILDTTVTQTGQLDIRAKSIIRIVPDQWYSEKWQREKDGETEYFWKVYALVKFSREEHEKYFDSLCSEATKIAKTACTTGERNYKNGNIVTAIRGFYSGLTETEEIINIAGIKPESLNEINSIRQTSVLRLNEIFGKIKIVTENLDQPVRINQPLSKPLKFKVLYKQSLGLSGLPWRFKFVKGKGEIDTEVVSDSNGWVVCNVQNITECREGVVIEAGLSFRPIGRFRPMAIKLEVSKSKKKFLIYVMNDKKLKGFLENYLTKQLSDSGYHVISNVDMSQINFNPSDYKSYNEYLTIKTKLLKNLVSEAKQLGADWLIIYEMSLTAASKSSEKLITAIAAADIKVIDVINNEVIIVKNKRGKITDDDLLKAQAVAITKITIPVIAELITEIQEKIDGY